MRRVVSDRSIRENARNQLYKNPPCLTAETKILLAKPHSKPQYQPTTRVFTILDTSEQRPNLQRVNNSMATADAYMKSEEEDQEETLLPIIPDEATIAAALRD